MLEGLNPPRQRTARNGTSRDKSRPAGSQSGGPGNCARTDAGATATLGEISLQVQGADALFQPEVARALA